MRSYGLAALLASYAAANPLPQGIDWDAVEALPELPTPSIPVVNADAAQTTVAFEAATAAAAVEAAVLADPNVKAVERRGALVVSGCTPDTKSLEQWQAQFSTAGASTPAGYERTFANLKASSQGVYGYMGYSVLPGGSYDTQECAKRCNSVKGCSSFNLYYERAPSVDPNDSCKNPASETVLKCVYYGGPVSERSATNDGQWRRDFRVVIAGSNGYVNKAISTPEGYQPAIPLGQVTMNVPNKDCAGNPTYLGVKIFQDGAFSSDKCAAACTATSDWNRAHPHVWQNGKPRLCQMFVTYILYNGTTATGQYCAMYDQSWPTTFATERGQWRDNGKSWFNMDYSYMFVNSTANADKPTTCDNPPAPNQPGVCRAGAFWSTSAKSCMSYVTCKDPQNEYLDKVSNTCIACNATREYLDKEAQKCVSYPTCDSTSQYLNQATKSCVAYPVCSSGQVLNKDTKTCETKACVQANLVPNPSFEEGSDTDIAGWTRVGVAGGSSEELPDTGSKHYIGRFRTNQNSAQIYTRVKGIEVGKKYKFRARVGLGTKRNFGSASCSVVPIFGHTSVGFYRALEDVSKPVGQYQTMEAWVSIQAGRSADPEGENLGWSMSCGNVQGLEVDVLIDSVEIIDPTCEGTLVPQQPTCNTETHWLDLDKNVCVAYPTCSGADKYPFQVLNKDTKACELSRNATCNNLMQVAELSPTYKSGNNEFSLLCQYEVIGQEIQVYSNYGYKQCLDICAGTIWPTRCNAVTYSGATKECMTMSGGRMGSKSSTDDGAVVIQR